jgi:hypothetical protein
MLSRKNKYLSYVKIKKKNFGKGEVKDKTKERIGARILKTA